MTVPYNADITKLYNIYGLDSFASALGAANPEEDFVEAYAIQAVTESSPQFKLRLTIDPKGARTVITVNDPDRNSNKFGCVHDLLAP
jgi:hypothetical protein